MTAMLVKIQRSPCSGRNYKTRACRRWPNVSDPTSVIVKTKSFLPLKDKTGNLR